MHMPMGYYIPLMDKFEEIKLGQEIIGILPSNSRRL